MKRRSSYPKLNNSNKNKKNLKKYYDILELNPGATISEIKKAFLRLKKIYSADSSVISPIAKDFSKRKRRDIIKRLDSAYTHLIPLLKKERQKPKGSDHLSIASDEQEKEKEKRSAFSGQVLKQIRKKLGVQLYEVSLDTKIRQEILKNIEHEKYELLPPKVYLKGHLRNYASYLSLNPKKVTNDYIRKFEEWKIKEKKK